MVPSPPPATTASVPAFTAARAASQISSPGMSRTSASVPAFWNISRRLSAVMPFFRTEPPRRFTSTVTFIQAS